MQIEDKTNLLEETKDAIGTSGHSPTDIIFIGSFPGADPPPYSQRLHGCTWEQFQVLADVYYDAGYGYTEVAIDLTVVFRDSSYLFRREYDGSEGWTSSRIPPFTSISSINLPVYAAHMYLPISRLIWDDKIGSWDDSLAGINRLWEEDRKCRQ